MARAVFIDQEGTLTPETPANVELIRLHPFAGRGLRMLQEKGYILFVMSNPSALAHDLMTEHQRQCLEQRIDTLLAQEHVRLDGHYFCPHRPDGTLPPNATDCDCRKPQPGLIRRAAVEHGIELPRSWIVGNTLNDIERGRLAGCKTVLVSSGNETEWRISPQRLPHLIAFNLYRAAEAILLSDPVR